MRSIVMIIASVASETHTIEQAPKHIGSAQVFAARLVDRVVNEIIHLTHHVWPLHRTDLESITTARSPVSGDVAADLPKDLDPNFRHIKGEMDYSRFTKVDEHILSLVRAGMKSIKVASSADIVYSDECVLSFDTPFSPQGLFVSLATFRGFGAGALQYDRSGCPLYLHIRKVKIPKKKKKHKKLAGSSEQTETEPEVTKLAIGIKGGFATEEQRFDVDTMYALFILPGDGTDGFFVKHPDPQLPEYVSMVMKAIINHTPATIATATKWEDAPPKPSKYYKELDWVKTGKTVSPNPRDWQCEESGMKENLWLNLGDGYIGSGRRNWDGSGGTGAALRHYEELLKEGKHCPLAVKLGTITTAGADVYSYAKDENDAVTDPDLAAHLSRWGIDIMHLEKTEKTTSELSVELNLNYNFAAITEDGEDLVPVFGPGYMGLKNLGNSCYMNAVVQVLFSLPEFGRYLKNADKLFQSCSADPTADLNVQLCKLATGLHTDKYLLETRTLDAELQRTLAAEGMESRDVSKDEAFISPFSFKALVGKGHPQFSSSDQQDAAEYLEHLFSVFRQYASVSGNADDDMSRLFQFELEHRTEAADRSVKYEHSPAMMISLGLPVNAVNNQADVEAYERNTEKRNKSKSKKADAPVLPNIPFSAVWEAFTAPDIFLFQGGNASKSTKFATFPAYLWVQMLRYTLDEKWQPKKLDHTVAMPDTLNLSRMIGKGFQDGEMAMKGDDVAKGTMSQPTTGQIREDIVREIVGMGFTENAGKRAVLATKNTGVQEAMEWLVMHTDDMDLNDPFVANSGADGGREVDQMAVGQLCALGFTFEEARFAIRQPGNTSPDEAAMWLFSNKDNLAALMAADEALSGAQHLDNALKRSEQDTGITGTYDLVGIISHIGQSTTCGHYVCHVKKEGRWIYYNDRKVVVSKKPPIQHGFLYLYQAVRGVDGLGAKL